jgi:hypothetical protein
MSLRRRGFLPLGILLLLAGAVIALTAAAGGSASNPTSFTSSPCPPTDGGRAYCVTLTTFGGVQPTGGQKVEVQAFNHDQNTLTNLVITVHPITTRLDVDWSTPKPSNCVAGTGDDVVCTLPNVPGLGAAAKNNPPPAPIPSEKVTLYFSSVATGASPLLSWNASARVQEGPSGQPNTSVRDVTGATSFGTDPDSPLTIALPGSNVLLGTTNTGRSSLRFSVPGSTQPYEASLNADDTTGFCLEGLDCYPLELTSSVPGSSSVPASTGGLLIWHWFAVDPAFNKNTVKVIHIKDGVTTTANAANTGANPNSIAGDFRAVEGVRISGGTAFDGDYWVRFPTTSSFQISLTKTGPIFDIPGTGTVTGVLAGKLDIVDTRDEDCKTLAGAVTTPSLWADSVDADSDGKKDDVEVWFCDGTNGNVGGF